MVIEKKIAKAFHLTDENWMRHANPISVWSRYSVLPIIVLTLWSRVWIGYWCLIPIALSIAWMFLNPILFQEPTSTKNWASKAVLGERVFMNRDQVDIPAIHRTPLFAILNTVSSIGLIVAIWAAVSYSFAGAIVGVSAAYLGKSWFLDRMVWLYEDMKNNNDVYKSWDY